MKYGTEVWGGSSHGPKMLVSQKKAVRAIEGVGNTESCRPLFKKHSILTFYGVYILQQLLQTKKDLHKYQQRNDIHQHNTRQCHYIQVPQGRLNCTRYTREGISLYNAIPEEWKRLPTRDFRRKVTAFLTESPPYSLSEYAESMQGYREITTEIT